MVNTPDRDSLRTLALRIGLASHPTFAAAIHERLVLDCLSDLPTARPSLNELRRTIATKFRGVDLTASQLQVALKELEDQGWIEVETAERTGDVRYFLTLQGQEQWSQARREGRRLEDSVRDEFFTERPDQKREADSRWAALVGALDSLFADHAFRIAQCMLESGGLEPVASELSDSAEVAEESVRADLHAFLNEVTSDRAVFLRRLLHGALAFHLFRASPEADEAVLRHLRGRTLYLDTTVLYALVAEEGELSSLGDDLRRIALALECRLEVTTETIAEFQESVTHYKDMLVNRGITDAGIARVVVRDRLGELDDFRRGYYRALIRKGSLEVDAYALRYETIEERLSDWGIAKPRPLPTTPVRGPDGNWIQIEHVQDFEQSLGSYLKKHPRRVLPKDETVRRALIYHDALHIAWVAAERQKRDRVQVPTRPSQVYYWFLTRDRIVAEWDRRYVASNGPGRVPRCLGLEEWIESVAVFVPAAQESEALNSLVLRLVALHAPSIRSDDDLDLEDLQRIGRVAQSLELQPDESARLVADRTLQEQLDKAFSTDQRIAAVKDGVLRLREEQLGSMGTQLELFREEAGRLPELQKQIKAFGEERRAAALREDALTPDAEIGRRLRSRGPWAALSFVGMVVMLFGLLLAVPSIWGQAGLLRRVLIVTAASSAAVLVPLWVLGFERRAKALLTAIVVVAGGVATFLDFWDRSAAPKPAQGEEVVTPDSSFALPENDRANAPDSAIAGDSTDRGG